METVKEDSGHYYLYPKEVEVMKSWISTCTKEHKDCNPLTSGHYFPTRLLDLRTPILRLIDGKDLRPSGRYYATLSYCWGTTMPEGVKTTRSNIHARRAGIDIHILPRTLREAIYVAHALAIPFIWIDVLCIIQDEVEDWAAETTKMFQIYSHALVTIAAALTDHCEGGFLLPRITHEDNFPLVSNISACKSVQHSCLSKRGWPLQERHLSTRIIHFSSSHITWQCREHFYHYQTVSRKQPKVFELDNQYYHSDYYRANIERCFDSTSSKKSLLMSDYKRAWYLMMEGYSHRVFTNPRDKLAAIDGLAEAMKPFLNSNYLFGLWSADILDGILWYRGKGEETHPPFNEYYAPSWSWASGNFPISWTSKMYRSFNDYNSAKTVGALILEVSTIPTKIYPTVGGFIRLEATARALDAPGAPEMILIFDNPKHPLLDWESKQDNGKAFIKVNEISPSYSPQALGEFIICRVSCGDILRDETSTISHELVLQSTQHVYNGIPEYKRVGLAQEIPLEWIEQGTRQEIILV